MRNPRSPRAFLLPVRLRLLIPLLAVGLTLAGSASARAATSPLLEARVGGVIIGMGDQKSQMFADRRFRELGIRRARLVVAWDALDTAWQREEVDAWLDAARRAGVEPLVAFARSREFDRRRVLPSPARFRRAFDAFRDRYPWVRVYSPWNEVNHCSQPTCHRPRRAAAYYNVMRLACPRCRILAADVLDVPGMVPWLREFRRHARGNPRLWGLHNYVDANRFQSTGTRAMLRTVPGQVWLTEVGGLVSRNNRSQVRFPESPAHAAQVMRWVFRLTSMSYRLTRVYIYHWNVDSLGGTWDSALIGPDGSPRPALGVLERALRRSGRRP